MREPLRLVLRTRPRSDSIMEEFLVDGCRIFALLVIVNWNFCFQHSAFRSLLLDIRSISATCPPHRSHISRPCPVRSTRVYILFQPIKNTQKWLGTSEMHNKSNFYQKNVKPIFIALSCLVLPRKNTKPCKKTKLPLGKCNESKL